MDDPAEPLLGTFFQIFKPFTIEAGFSLLLMAVLLFLSALVSSSEVAFFSLNHTDLKNLEANKERKSDLILQMLKKPKLLLANILISNNLINVAIIILSTLVINDTLNFQNHQTLGFVFQVVFVTFLILLIGEVVPKVYATKNAIKIAQIVVYPFFLASKVLNPLANLLVVSTNFIDKRFKQTTDSISVDELSHALELANDESGTQEDQKILKGIVKFGNTAVRQIMTARVDVVAVEQTATYTELKKIILETGYSRIPVFEENFDNIKGILYIKDLLPHLNQDNQFNWQGLMRQAFYVPENKKIDDLLKEFQQKKIHLAIVVDEYGGSSGVISLEDILEEIVGEISDEFDDEDVFYSKIDDQNFVFQGKILLNDFYRAINIEGNAFEETKGDADTLAGFLLEIHGKIPKKNEVLTFNDYLFKIESADNRKISSIKVTLPQPAVNHED